MFLVMRVILLILEIILYLLYRGIGPLIVFILQIILQITLQIISFCLIGTTGVSRLNYVCDASCKNLQKKNPNTEAKDGQKRVFVEFNAWVYNGSDVLWASLMECLLKSVETEYGQSAVRMHRVSIALSQETPTDVIEIRKRKRREALSNYKLKVVVSSIVALLGTCLGIFLLSSVSTESVPTPPPSSSESVSSESVSSESDKCFDFGTDWTCDTVRTLTGVLSISLSLVPFFFQLCVFFTKVLPRLSSSPVDVLLATVYTGVAGQGRDFLADTGFMGEVKKEMAYLFDFLEIHDSRLCIFVDDVDRCTPQTVFDVLQAVHLLLQSGIVTCWLAIDIRIVESCINDVCGDVLRAAGELMGLTILRRLYNFPFVYLT